MLFPRPNFGSGAGSCSPLMVVVALGEPSTSVTSWAKGPAMVATANVLQSKTRVHVFMVRPSLGLYFIDSVARAR